jgi:hypothetical protein
MKPLAWALILLGLSVADAGAQMVTGAKMPGYTETFRVDRQPADKPCRVQFLTCTSAGNIVWPGERPAFTFQVVNTTAEPLEIRGQVEVIAYGTKGLPGDIWVPEVFKIADVGFVPAVLKVAPKGWQNITVRPTIPERFGGYCLVLDLGSQGRRVVTSCVRTFKADAERVRFPKLGMDITNTDVLYRTGCKSIRLGMGFTPPSDPNFEKWYAQQAEQLKQYYDANVSVIVEYGGGAFRGRVQPFAHERPWLDETGKMLNTKFDLAWTPDYDEEFKQVCKRLAAEFGWPRGPVVAVKLWNEPWEGISIAGWGADLPRYREIYTAMAVGTEAGCKDAGTDVLIGGCDSSSNTLDKLFSDGSDQMLKWLDFCSIHYEGLHVPSTIKAWVNRKHPHGRVLIWDTESWVANCDDRVAAVLATNISSGHDRAVGIYGGNICSDNWATELIEGGGTRRIRPVQAYSVAAAVAAAQRFLGERNFQEMLFKNGLPWVMLFHGKLDPVGREVPDDGTIVVVGDIGDEFGHDNILFRSVRGLANIPLLAEAQKALDALPDDASKKDRADAERALVVARTLRDAVMTLSDGQGKFSLYDFYGNPVPGKHGKIIVPLDHRGFYLRADGTPGSWDALVKAVQSGDIQGLEPLAKVCHDMTAPIGHGAVLRLSLTNILNRPIQGRLSLKLSGLTLDPAEQSLTFDPHETKEVAVKVEGAPNAANSYPLSLAFEAGKDGIAVHDETMHVNYIARRTIQIDGKLDDWKDVLPQTIVTSQRDVPTLTEFAWTPFKKFDDKLQKGFATGYLAYDQDYFYFAAKIADSTPDEGTMRFETRDDSQFFYPQHCYEILKEGTNKHDEMWDPASTDIRALQKFAADPKDVRIVRDKQGHETREPRDRIAAGWRNERDYMVLDLSVTDGKPHQLALYCLDWGNSNRAQRVEIVDPATWKVLDQQAVQDFTGGRYMIWTIRGKVQVRLWGGWGAQRLPAVVSGVFADPAKSDESPEGQATPAARFVRADLTTQGNWKGAYGSEGYAIAGDATKFDGAVKLDVPEQVALRLDYTWPDQFRRYSYRRGELLPCGNFPRFDNVQIAFNVLPPEEKDMLPCPPGTMPGYVAYQCTDYEYALNKVAAQYGGGFEVWRLRVPGMPHKHFYPREPKSRFDGPVRDAKLVTIHEGNTRLVEAAIPWSEIPHVKKKLDAGEPIKFSFRVNDNGGGGCMELSHERSVAKRNASFQADWVEHWANELEFGWEK